MSSQPQGTFLPNTKVTVGSHKVYIEKYLSEGGFAHVYVVRIPREGNKHEIAVLKRVAVPDKEHLANMRTEVDTMKKLKGHRHIVTYIDSHASQMKGGGYEVFLLMEYCSGGGLIDFMNTRLQHRLTEPEILKIFADCTEGVACMHYLKPPLLHRDLKVENVLITKSTSSSSPLYKICDFGSAASPRPAATTVEEGKLIEDDVQKHTTMQYRSPEMIDVWRKQPIDEKADIWALGVLLYKLCYYTTPFEDVGQMAILNASYKYPQYPTFSDRLKKLIGWMLKEDPKNRPNIYQVLKEVCNMRGTEVPIKDIYATRTQSEARRNESLPSADALSSQKIGLQKTAPQVLVQAIPDIAPMRRGRPTATATHGSITTQPSPSPARGDPFAALESKSHDVRAGAVDELSRKFPSLDEFSIAHEGGRFAFPSTSPSKSAGAPKEDLSARVTNALADEVFSQSLPKSSPSGQPVETRSPPVNVKEVRQPPTAQKPRPGRPGYASTATGTSPPRTTLAKLPEISTTPVWSVPEPKQNRQANQPRPSEAVTLAASGLHPSLPTSQRSGMLELHRSKSQTAVLQSALESSSSRPSLEGQRPSGAALADAGVARARSVNSRMRPTSMYVSSNMEYLRDQEQSRKRPSMEPRQNSRHGSYEAETAPDENAIEDDMDYLRNSEESEIARRRSKHSHTHPHTHHKKRSSLNAISGAKHIISGRLGDAFKRFEHQSNGNGKEPEQDAKTPEAHVDEDDFKSLSPIAGSEATLGRYSDVDSALDETEDLPPDVRREMERRRLSQEERRIAEAAAEYRMKVAAQGTGGPVTATRASTIQNRVQSLLDEGRQSPAPKRTAEGYGRYTDVSDNESKPVSRAQVPLSGGGPPLVARKPAANLPSSNIVYPKTRQEIPAPMSTSMPTASVSAPPTAAPLERIASRPNAPPKPIALRTGGQWPPIQQPISTHETAPSLPTSSSNKPSGLAALLAKDLEGVPDYPSRGSSLTHTTSLPPTSSSSSAQRSRAIPPAPVMTDELEDFSKRYPSLSGIEMVEREIDEGANGAARGNGSRMIRVKDA